MAILRPIYPSKPPDISGGLLNFPNTRAMNVTARLIRLLTRAALYFTALSISAVSARPHPADHLVSGETSTTPPFSPVIDDSLAASDSTLADSTEPLKPLDPLVAFRARSTLSMLYSDTLELQTVRPMAIARSFAFYADDILRLAPSLAGGDSPGQRLTRAGSRPWAVGSHPPERSWTGSIWPTR